MKEFFIRPSFFLSVHIDEEVQQVCLLRFLKNKRSLELVYSFPLHVNSLDILAPLLANKNYSIVTGLEPNALLIRGLKLKLKSAREIKATLPFQLENLFPDTQGETILLPTLYKEEETTVFLMASSTSHLNAHLAFYEKNNIDPDIVSCVPLALFRFAKHFFKERSSMLLYHIGLSQSVFVVIEQGRLQLSQTHQFGCKDLLARETFFKNDLDRMLSYLHKKHPEVKDVLLTGALKNNMEPLLTKLFPQEFSFLEMKDFSLKEYAIAIGLALDAAVSDKQSAQFRQVGPASKKSQTKAKKGLFYTFSAAFLCFMVTFFLGNARLKEKENALSLVLNISKQEKIEEALSRLEESLLTQKEPLLSDPTVPSVSQTLLWLSAHPKLEGVSLINFKYELITIPKLGTSHPVYEARVDLELSTSEPLLARSFYEALLSDQKMIDHAHDVSWSHQYGIYSTHFFLKSFDKKKKPL